MDTSLCCVGCGRVLTDEALRGLAASFCQASCCEAWLAAKPPPQPVVAAVVLALSTDGRVAMSSRRKQPHLWGLVGGMREPGEQPTDTARRELREETGLAREQLVPVYVHARPDGPGDVAFFAVEGLAPSPLQPGPGEPPARWAPIEALWGEQSPFPGLYRRVWVAFEHRGRPARVSR
jgi:8-oxo-dGTP pyrophosphatase MutT (NUDIX family)